MIPEMRRLMRLVEAVLMDDVFHGSPHNFDRFSMSGAGTGQGAASYGWGLYFASKEAIADYYRRTLTGDDEDQDYPRMFILDGKVVDASRPENQLTPDERAAYAYVCAGMRKSVAIEDLESSLEYMRDGPAKDMDRETLDVLKHTNFAGRVKRWGGVLYSVSIPDDSTYLLWDKPLPEQPAPVKRALALLGVNLPKTATGEIAYKTLSEKLGSQKDASLALLAHSVHGIKYLDGVSRESGHGTYNYVLFDDSRLSITDKERY